MHVQDHVNLCILRMFEGTFALDVAQLWFLTVIILETETNIKKKQRHTRNVIMYEVLYLLYALCVRYLIIYLFKVDNIYDTNE